MRCPACYGFWAAGDSLEHAVRDATDEHPSFTAAMAPSRCRACLGHLKPDGVCAKCGRALPTLECPACNRPMERNKQKSVTLDVCGRCKGVWFDVGEIGHVYGLQPYQDLPASLVDEHACDDEPPGWLLMLGSILRLIAPFI
jgi:Zn-finger nucleic acid-binding protein